jgi:acyl-CoA synthetase (AMP-forming)/AMP-acid ligase II
LRPGDRLIVDGQSTASVYHLVLGALRTGIVPVLINPALLPAERSHIVGDALAAAEVSLAQAEEAVEHGVRADLSRVPLARPMLYTSGTTGTPKGVFSGVLSERLAERLWGEEVELWQLDPSDRYVQIGPLYHSAPLRFAICTQLAGGTVVIPGPFDARRTAGAAVESAATFGFAAPIHVRRMLDHRPDSLASYRLLAHAGAPCPEPLKRSMIAAAPPGAIWEFYGSTEGQFTVCSPEDYEVAPASVGRPRPHREIRTDEDGVIWCRAPEWARFEYWGDPDRTARAWEGDWFTVGDLGRVDDAGFVYLEGRRGDLIISGGVNVYPVEVEKALLGAGCVEDVAVFGLDDTEWGQAVCAVVVSDAPETVLRQHAAERLAGYKRPKHWFRVDRIPVSSTGKVRRERLATDLGLAEGID